MARRRVPPRPALHGVPAELTDPGHPTWTTEAACEALAAEWGVPVSRWPTPTPLRDPAFERFKAFRFVWADHADLLNEWGRPDMRALADLGVYAGSRAAGRVS